MLNVTTLLQWSVGTYEKTVQRNANLEKYTESLIEETTRLSQDVEEKSTAVENLMKIINNKSQEINKLVQDMEQKKLENTDLFRQLNDLRERFDLSILSSESEKLDAMKSLQTARQESHELLEKVKNYDQIVHKNAENKNIIRSLELQIEDNKDLQHLLMCTMEENRKLKLELEDRENANSILLQQIQHLHKLNEYNADNISSLQEENDQYKMSLELKQSESGELKDKLINFENLTIHLKNLQEDHERLLEENKRLENELLEESHELENAKQALLLHKRESEDLMTRLQRSEVSKDDELYKISEAYQKANSEKRAAQKEIIEKGRYIDNLLQNINDLKLQNKDLLQKCKEANELEQELITLKKVCTEMATDMDTLQRDFDIKTDEYTQLYNTLENKIEENQNLFKRIKELELNQEMATNDIKALQDEKYSIQAKANVIEQESAVLIRKMKHYENLESELDELKRAHDQMRIEKENLQMELNTQLADLRRMEQENSELHTHSQTLLSHSEDLQNALIGARTELIRKSSYTVNSYKDVMAEIEALKNEKVSNQIKIRDLRDRLEESDNIISKFSEDIMARDDKIATLQNHINNLEEEVRKLHAGLAEAIDTGEQMNDFSFQKIDSLKNMEAHHSKATHNMKMEVAKLQHENSLLSEQLSITRIKSEEYSRDEHKKYVSQILQLQNEKEIIVTDIKQLELKSVGDTALAPNNCGVEDILTSLDRIRRAFDARNSRSSSLEQTLLKVQTSSQLLLSKADEAKKIVEREKQKIITEKEDAIKDKQNMEQQLHDLKEKLEKQIASDREVIIDLEATMQNQKLVYDNCIQSRLGYISKLEEELENLKDVYQRSIEKISELQEKLQNMNEDKNNLMKTMKNIKADLDAKSQEVNVMQKELEALRNKPSRNMGAQVQPADNYRNMGTQTDKDYLHSEDKKFYVDSGVMMSETKDKYVDQMDSSHMMSIRSPLDKKHDKLGGISPTQHLINEVQILAASIESPPFEVVKNSYINYKMKRLRLGKLEQQSIPCITVDDKEKSTKQLSTDHHSRKSHKSGKRYSNAKTQSNNLIDIYNRQSMHTNSSKGNEESDNTVGENMPEQSRGKSTGTGYPTRESYETDSNINQKHIDGKTYAGSSSDKSTDKDLFVIYNDSETSYTNIPNTNNANNKGQGTWSGKGHSEIVVEAVTVHPTKKGKSMETNPRHHIDQGSYIFRDIEETAEDDSVKHKLKINLPRVGIESPSVITSSDGDKKSLDSYPLGIYSSPKRLSDSDTKIHDDVESKHIRLGSPSLPTMSNDNQFLDSYNSLGVGSEFDTVRPGLMKTKAIETDSGTSKQKHSQVLRRNTKTSKPYESESHHRLSRVGADVLLLKSQDRQKPPEMRVRQNFGLEYILDTVQGEVDPDVANYYATKELRKTRSDERFNLVRIREKSESSPSRLSDLKISSTEYKTNSTMSKYSDKSQPKSYVERSIMAKLDINNEYENKITSLTKALENIEKDYKKKIEAIKVQYDSNIKSIINEHNQGVKSIQSLHEETLQDIIKLHENEVENLRSMSIEAMRKAEKLEKENRALKTKAHDCNCNAACLDEEPIKIPPQETKKRKKCRGEPKMLTKTTVEAFNVKPKTRANGPCTCSLDVNISDTIRNIFEQVDVEQRKMAEHTYMKYIANKIVNGNVEALDAQELSFLHLKVCRTWKMKLSKEEALQKRIDSLESELMSKQKNAQQHIAELDRKVAEERRRLQEVREAVCRGTPTGSRGCSPVAGQYSHTTAPPTTAAEKDLACGCNIQGSNMETSSRRSAGDLVPKQNNHEPRTPRLRKENNRSVLARLDVEERRERKSYNDEPPTRLRRSGDRQQPRANKK